MVADGDDHRARPDPGACRGGGIKIVEGAAAGVAAVQRVLGGTVRALGDGLVKLAVGDGGEGVRLIDHTGDRVRERGMAHAVEHHRPYRHLAVVGLAPGLGGDDARKKIHIAVAAAAASSAARRGDTERRQRGVAHLSVDGKAVVRGASAKVVNTSGRVSQADSVGVAASGTLAGLAAAASDVTVGTDVPKPTITGIKVVGGNVYVSVKGTVPFLAYGLSEGATPGSVTESVGETAAGRVSADDEITLVAPAKKGGGFFKVGQLTD